ncbi:MAG: tetratricopeptide repeat protein [Verrucomicrobiota bacterium]
MNRTLIYLFLVGWAVLSQGIAATLEEANQKFAAGDFPEAVVAYEKLLDERGPDAAVYYNLGNAYQNQKKLGHAILAYERARLLTPRDPDLRANLAMARKAATAFEESELHPRVDAVLVYLSRDEWSWLVVGGALFIGTYVLLRGLVKWQLRWTRQLGGTLAVLAGFAIAAGCSALWLRRDEGARGIVLTENASVRLSPFATAEALGTVTPGRVVRLGKSSGSFRYIEVPGTSLQGWLAKADVAAILPEVE